MTQEQTQEMASVRFVFFRGRSLVSRAIRFFTRSKNCSHVGFLSSDGDLLETWPGKDGKMFWRYSGFDLHTPGTHYEVWEKQVNVEDARKIFQTIHMFVLRQKRYDYWGIASFLTKSEKHSEDKLFCSEGCMIPLVRVFNWDQITPSHISPQGMLEIIQAAGWKLTEKGTT